MKFIKGRQLKGEKGFTLMELMVVMLILAVLAAYGIPRYLSSIHASKLGMVVANYDAIVGDTASAYYDVSLVGQEAVAKKVGGDNYDTLTNPFATSSVPKEAVVITADGATYQYYTGSTWAAYTFAGGEVVLDYTSSDQVIVTAYDDTKEILGGYTKTITNPR